MGVYLLFSPRLRGVAHGFAVVATGVGVAVVAAPDAWPARQILMPLHLLRPVNQAFAMLSIGALAAAFARVVARTEMGLIEERARADRLLLNVLPASIADRLKAEPTARIADRHAETSVLFADIVGFTVLAGRQSPDALVAMLNDLFSAFDAICEREGAERIKTMGDGYLAVCGLPSARADHVEVIARVGLAICAHMDSEAVDPGLQVRVGIHTGPVVAGIIGRSRFHYDLWGDTVNIASRMESTGVPGRVQCTEAVRAKIHATLPCEARGAISVKGKGEMDTFFVCQAND